MRCGKRDCRTPDDDVRPVRDITLCATHRLMCWGSLEPKSKRHRLTSEQQQALWKARAAKR